LLSNDANIYTKPQLEIFADDVKCSHGATSSQIEDSELFYLQARGIGKEVARGLLVYAFAAELVERVKNEKLRAKLQQRIAELLKIEL
jgi:Fe-S cluster assembly protein SufD